MLKKLSSCIKDIDNLSDFGVLVLKTHETSEKGFKKFIQS
jgi:hypothetical protein